VGEGVLQLYAKCIVPIPIKLITVHWKYWRQCTKTHYVIQAATILNIVR
jgi:hypothetical protein